MFSRIRYAAHVLTYSHKPDPFTQPDIVFEEAQAPEISKISRSISNAISFLAVALTFGFLSAFVVKELPVVRSQNVTVVAGVLGIILAQLWNQFHQALLDRIHTTLRMGERMSPYFGNRITKVVRILRS